MNDENFKFGEKKIKDFLSTFLLTETHFYSNKVCNMDMTVKKKSTVMNDWVAIGSGRYWELLQRWDGSK